MEDTGVGIKKDKLQHLFKVFGKLKDSGKMNKSGVGLGLMISKEIVEAMSGNITISSVHGKGTSFYFNMVVGVVQNPELIDQSSHNDSIAVI